MSYRDALRSAEQVDRISKGTRVRAELDVVVAHIGGRVQSIRERGPGPLLEEMDAADANAPIFEAHMAFEEQVIGPHMTKGDLYKLRAEHAYIRRFRRRGIVVPARFVQLHAAWEKKIFPTIGAPGGAPTPS